MKKKPLLSWYSPPVDQLRSSHGATAGRYPFLAAELYVHGASDLCDLLHCAKGLQEYRSLFTVCGLIRHRRFITRSSLGFFGILLDDIAKGNCI
jgi:hypothetical protein